MKKLQNNIITLLSIIMVGTLVSCASSKTKATKAADSFLSAYFSKNIGEAKKYATKSSASRIDELASKIPSGVSYTIDKNATIVETDTTAKVFYTRSDNNLEKSLSLKKENGKWKVYLGKDDSVKVNEFLKKRLEERESVNNK